ncbi:MAG: LON peptidase substrate-binding domain-containing protein, partial [Bacteroidales bacterium]|nr:LON peptidase substrate-binding domain-containing protein [Bacteroidales bacterium]
MTKNQNTGIQMIADYEGDISNLFEASIEGNVPVLATRNMVLFPGVISPILIGRTESLNLIKRMMKDDDGTFAVFCQFDPSVEVP